ncbi:uncharacterized protein LOC100897952 [Galendromus occidentalis]|uniref:Uncharacterized protein LOC100897952 n=1 Tax=Galendromus occidentalis TaxID=34638 RepID=A0AAJ7SGV7_9ACAR|nr:uncharacterized protein LOC100897952 [Galendromus occidentalis]
MSHNEEVLPYYYETNECSTDSNCSVADPNAVCDEYHSRCICLHELYRDITVPEIRCVGGRQINQWCSSSKQCYVVNTQTTCVGSFMRSLCKCLHGFYFNADNKSCVQYPEGEVYMVDEADKIMFFNANFMAFAVFVFLAVIILAIQKDLICDILKGKISPLNDAMNAEAEEGVDRIQNASSTHSSPMAGPAEDVEAGAAAATDVGEDEVDPGESPTSAARLVSGDGHPTDRQHGLQQLLANTVGGTHIVTAVPAYECSVDLDCSSKDSNAVCDTNHSLCKCTNGLYRGPPYREIKCSVGKAYNERCRSPRECLLVDQYSDCVAHVCRCLPGYNPIPGANISQGSVRCLLDEYRFNADHAHLTFFKVSPVPLLVICIILVYLGYQRGAKVPQRRGSSTSNRRIVPMWRGVTFHQATTPPRNSTTLPNGSAGSNSSGSQNGHAVVMVGDAGLRRESSSATDSRRSRGSAHSQRDSSGRERQERAQPLPSDRAGQTHDNNNSSSRPTERRDSAMSPPPPYAQEEAPPSYEDAIRASRVASREPAMADLAETSNRTAATSTEPPNQLPNGTSVVESDTNQNIEFHNIMEMPNQQVTKRPSA